MLEGVIGVVMYVLAAAWNLFTSLPLYFWLAVAILWALSKINDRLIDILDKIDAIPDDLNYRESEPQELTEYR